MLAVGSSDSQGRTEAPRPQQSCVREQDAGCSKHACSPHPTFPQPAKVSDNGTGTDPEGLGRKGTMPRLREKAASGTLGLFANVKRHLSSAGEGERL